METSQPSSPDPSAAAAAADAADYPHWVFFADQRHKAGLCPSPADPRTVAHARTSMGHSVRVSFCLAVPPAVSRLDLDHGLPDGANISTNVIAAHGDSVLISTNLRACQIDRTDYFVYNAGGGAAHPSRPPSLSLLPTCYRSEKSFNGKRLQLRMGREDTAILRRGDGEFVVAATYKYFNTVAELHILRSSERQWKTKRLQVRHDVKNFWHTDKLIPVGDRFFYWVDLHQGILFSDMSEETPELRFVPLPVEPILRQRKDWDMPEKSRSLCVTDGGATLKFVHVFPRCCCGGPGATRCELSRHAFTITTWTLRTTTQSGDMGWEMNAVVDCGELWALDAYGPLPRLPMDFPVVSIDNPDVVCFKLSEHQHDRDLANGDKTTWVVMIDTRTKALLRSAILYSKDKHYHCEALLPSQLSRNFSYFNTSHGPGSSKHSAPPASGRRRRENIVDVSPPALPAPDEEILAALLEIPGLSRDEMLRAYGVLACDDRRWYCTLVALPMNMRKDYCCILVDMATSKCSSCSARLAAATGAL